MATPSKDSDSPSRERRPWWEPWWEEWLEWAWAPLERWERERRERELRLERLRELRELRLERLRELRRELRRRREELLEHLEELLEHLERELERLELPELEERRERLELELRRRLELELRRREELPHPLTSPQLSQSSYLRGVDVIGEIGLSVTNEAQTFHWAGYGLKLHFPPASLPAGVEHTSIEMKASLTGEFNFPENTTLVSAVYSLHSPVEFSQPIGVEIQHCAIPSDDPSLTFARATQEEPPYKFIALEGGLFPHDSCHACIQLNRFSLVAIIKQLLLSLLPHVQRRYCAHVYYTREAQKIWRAHFVITQDLDAYITVVADKYKEAASSLKLSIAFEENEIVLEVPREGFTVPEQWTVTPMMHPGITKEEVDSVWCGQLLPSCQLSIKWRGKGEPESFECMVGLKGAVQPRHYFLIELVCSEDVDSQNQQSSRGEEGICDRGRKKESMEDKAVSSASKRQSKDEAVKLADLIHHVTTPRWLDLGLALKVDEHTLESIETDTRGDCQTGLRHMFQKWLSGCQHPSWDDIVRALWRIGEKSLSTQINKKFCYFTLE